MKFVCHECKERVGEDDIWLMFPNFYCEKCFTEKFPECTKSEEVEE